MIEIKDLTYQIGNKVILDGITTSFEKGKIHGIIGPNGAGKSTLLKHMMGILKPSKGSVYLEGKAIETYSVRDYAKRCSFVFQENTRDHEFTVEELLYMGRYPYNNLLGTKTKEDDTIVQRVVEDLQLQPFLKRLLKTLSGGEAQKVFIGRALVQQTDVLLLDEPTSMLDIHNSIEILHLLKEVKDKYGITIVMVMHDLNLAFQFCEHMTLIQEGHVIMSGPTKTIMLSHTLQGVYGHKIDIIEANQQLYVVPKTG